MNPHFQAALEALKRASESMQDAHGAIVASIRGVMEANAEHNDLRETVERLERTVLSLRDEVTARRNERQS